MVHVGNVVDNRPESGMFLARKELISCEMRVFQKYDIINADSQMKSIIEAGVSVDYGHFSDRKSIRAMLKAGKVIREKSNEVDVVHVLWGTTTALITVLFSKKPVVISFCGSDLIGQVNTQGKLSLSGIISRFLSQISAMMASAIITKSERMKNTLWKTSRSKATSIPNGVNLNSFKVLDQDEVRAKLGWPKEEKTILFFNSGGAPVKNEQLARAVAAKMQEKRENVNLRVIHGVPHSELGYYYNAANVLLLTSFHEGSNNSLKEALACNLPIVSVDVGDSRQRIEKIKNCYLVESYSVSEVSEAVEKVFQSGKRSNGRDFIDLVSMNFIANRVIDVYKKAIRK